MTRSLFDQTDPPKLTLVAPLAPAAIPRSASDAQPSVLVEPQADGQFVVSRLRHGGTTSAAVVHTRAELEELLRRIPPALEVGE